MQDEITWNVCELTAGWSLKVKVSARCFHSYFFLSRGCCVDQFLGSNGFNEDCIALLGGL